ncbi:hypothetical protein B0H13DRAFT_2666081 [Mycena leptocephala]|nr:hypothetical protein B0H13DRAFT_2666081 [Mycena leptocephala]
MSLSQEVFESREGVVEMVPEAQHSVANGNPALDGKIEGARRIRYTPGIKSALVRLLTATHAIAARAQARCDVTGPKREHVRPEQPSNTDLRIDLPWPATPAPAITTSASDSRLVLLLSEFQPGAERPEPAQWCTWTQCVPSSLSVFPSLIYRVSTPTGSPSPSSACSTQQRASMLINILHHALTHSMRPHIRTALLSPARSRLQNPCAVFHVHSAAAAPEIPAHRLHLVHRTIDTAVHACVHRRRRTVHLPEHRDGHAQCILSPASYILAGAHVLAATPSRLCAYPIVFARSRIVGYCVLQHYL